MERADTLELVCPCHVARGAVEKAQMHHTVDALGCEDLCHARRRIRLGAIDDIAARFWTRADRCLMIDQHQATNTLILFALTEQILPHKRPRSCDRYYASASARARNLMLRVAHDAPQFALGHSSRPDVARR